MMAEANVILPSFVFFTREITASGLSHLFESVAYDLPTPKRVGIKVHSGEIGGKYYLKPDLLRNLVRETAGTIIDANTPYGVQRCTNEGHWRTFREHGFTEIAKCDLLDEDGDTGIQVPAGKFLQTSYVGSHLLRYDSVILTVHFKGHRFCGFGGALKDYSIGLASQRGKCLIHSAGTSDCDPNVPTRQMDFFETMIDAMQAITMLRTRFIFINILNNLSVDGDGCPNPHEPVLKDLGMLASLDPVALDQASLDLLYREGNRSSLIKRIQEKQGSRLIQMAADRGVGNKSYCIQML